MSSIHTPPVDPGDLDLPPEEAKWPRVVGIVSICWASLGIVCGGCAPIAGVFAMSMIPADMRSEFPPNMAGTPAMWVVVVVGLFNTALLLAAGIVTMRRRPLGGMLHLAYGAAAVVIFVISMVLQFQHQDMLAQWAAQNPGTAFAKQMSNPGQKVGTVIGMVFGGILGLAYPIFVVVWFGVIKRRPETWGSRGRVTRI